MISYNATVMTEVFRTVPHQLEGWKQRCNVFKKISPFDSLIHPQFKVKLEKYDEYC